MSGGDVLYNLPAGSGDPDAAVGGGWAEQGLNRRNVITTGGGDESFYNVGWACFRAFHYGERPLPGRRYTCYIPPLTYSQVY